MKIIDRTFSAPEDNLACDEALLDLCEDGHEAEILRFWQPAAAFVVLGYSNPALSEVRLENCRRMGVPVLRRSSGGGTVLQGPGCLNYALVLKIGGRSITEANAFVMQRHRSVLAALIPDARVTVEGHTDLALGPLKFSGNAQRRKRRFFLFHGTFLTGFDIPLIEKFLPMPSKEPGYRKGRGHADFLTNVPLSTDAIKAALVAAWDAREPLKDLPLEAVRRLAKRHRDEKWVMKF